MTLSEETFRDAWYSSKNWAELMEKLKTRNVRDLRKRRARYEAKYGKLPPIIETGKRIREGQLGSRPYLEHHAEIFRFSGTIAVFSDAHFHPDHDSDAFLIFLQVLEELKPHIIVNNGDAFDGGSISRFPRLGWERKPSVAAELKACKSSLERIRKASPDSRRLWCVGNHDIRFDSYISRNAPELEDVPGTRITEQFPEWNFNLSIGINDRLFIKHRIYSGIHASYNNVLKSGTSIVTGHTHRLMCRPWTDYNGIRYGIETGTLANIYGPQFSFMENNPRDWSSGFVVLDVDENRVLPELVHVLDGKTHFRGHDWNV